MDDIPEAVRERIDSQESSSFPLKLIVGGIFSLSAIVLLTGFFLSRPSGEVSIQPTVPATPPPSPQPKPTSPPSPPVAAKAPAEPVDNLLGHLPYPEVSTSKLTAITADGRIRLRQEAAAKFKQMQADAQAEGIILTPISGFRSVSEQDYLFFRVKEQRIQNTTKRAEVSAPPGYSEHHTGYAVDIGDGNVPATNLSVEFENTPAFNWLKNNAARYSFELSFPRNNSQGISYEPWHWRYVGDRESLETFYKARHLTQPSSQ